MTEMTEMTSTSRASSSSWHFRCALCSSTNSRANLSRSCSKSDFFRSSAWFLSPSASLIFLANFLFSSFSASSRFVLLASFAGLFLFSLHVRNFSACLLDVLPARAFGCQLLLQTGQLDSRRSLLFSNLPLKMENLFLGPDLHRRIFFH